MEQRGMSQAELAYALHLQPPAVSKLLNGPTDPTATQLIAISRVLRCPVAVLFGEQEIDSMNDGQAAEDYRRAPATPGARHPGHNHRSHPPPR